MAQIMYAGGIRESLHPTSIPRETWVREVLEPDQISTAKHRFGRARLTPGTTVLLWGLRVYVLLMTYLIGLQIWHTLRAGR